MKEYGMQFKKLRKKIKTIFDNAKVNLNTLDLNYNIFNRINTQDNIIRNGKVLYDSDWFYIDIFDSGTGISFNEELYGYIFNTYGANNGATSAGQLLSFFLTTGLKQRLTIKESWLPYIEANLLVKSVPTYQFYGAVQSEWSIWNQVNSYRRAKGDSTLIYQGTDPDAQKFPDTDITDGNILSSLTSKWYYGTVKYTISSTPYSATGFINSVNTYYNLSYNAGADEYDYEQFSTGAIDAISSTSVTGTGTYTVAVWVDDGFGNWSKQETTTKNVTKTAPLRDDYTILSLINPTKSILFEGILGGNATLTDWDFSYNNTLKLFYSSSRSREFDYNTNIEELDNFPTTADYQSGILPYTNLTVEVNPDDYPDSTTTILDRYTTKYEPIWIKISDNDFYCIFKTTTAIGIPANLSANQDLTYIDESYSHSGNSYIKDGDNRPGKQKEVFIPEPEAFQIRMQIVLNKEFNSINNSKYNIQNS